MQLMHQCFLGDIFADFKDQGQEIQALDIASGHLVYSLVHV